MIAKLTKELVAALHATGNRELEVVDPETSHLYVIVDGETHRQAMDALRRQQDLNAIAQGIAELESGQGIPLADARKLTQDRLLAQAMTFRVIILPQAQRDIDRNAEWWAEHHSVEQALQWAGLVYDQIETLAESPERNGLSAENGEFPYDIRDKLLGVGSRPSYRAVYTIRGDAVYVLTVRRAAQDTLRTDQIDSPPSA